ncbi:hypothetical protein DFA_01082 [Cavenderia fasciculata]|uniref:Uncharacterized protein n=1 Tax=Cavenderia fasciculata TaxID=261658 RepID=F4PQP0_CACFS|nr:uncharacterized protein DFA_01082 [Cavenderia fasciculata]EGG21207.1 hypothetical protein DFA_01082 [Cavenderia fasciculata]|eukprot:XP_004359057.1 hypothetical protein DFA_01082 [Cavenderia fasciculata]
MSNQPQQSKLNKDSQPLVSGTPVTPFYQRHFSNPTTTPSSSSSFNYSTPHQPPQTQTKTPSTIYRFQSPYHPYLTPDTDSRSLYDVNTPNQLSSTNDKNVHSPPRVTIPISELRNLSQKFLLSMTLETIQCIEKETEKKKVKVREWFRFNVFSDNQEIPCVQILRTVYSVFCLLTKSSKLSLDISSTFQQFWNSLTRTRSVCTYFIKINSSDTKTFAQQPKQYQSSKCTN